VIGSEQRSKTIPAGETKPDQDHKYMSSYVQRLVEPLPDRMVSATRQIVEGASEPDDTYRRYSEDERGQRSVAFQDSESESPIFRIEVHPPQPPDQVNNRVDVYVRSAEDGLQRVALLRDHEENTINITYRDPDTGEEKQNTRRGSDAGDNAAAFVIDTLPELQSMKEST